MDRSLDEVISDRQDLFNTIASLRKRPSIRYDRAGRSTGVATVILPTLAAAKEAIREFDGANAHGQPIRLTLVASVGTAATSYTTTGRPNPFEMAQKPSRSLFERISAPPSHTPGDVDDPSDGSASPDRIRARRADVLTKPVPEGIDRYVPGGRAPRRDIRGEHETGRSGGRRPGARRDHDGRDGGRKERGGRADGGDGRGGRRNGRPKKTQEELDAEMEDYWGGNAGPQNGQTGTATAEATVDGDVDMIE
ncbi:MAG: hypothetical protein M1817_000617 [Caeruleum heppii]|nr:MAG: hypothetical protein M1817_000617 [Caeruleum heppii]